MLTQGTRIPDWQVQDNSGKTHDLSDFRQKSHILILFDPAASQETLACWQKAVQADQKQWDWLNTKVLIVTKAPKEMAPGAYIVDRYGIFWTYYSPGHWTFDELEKDLVYYEARHC